MFRFQNGSSKPCLGLKIDKLKISAWKKVDKNLVAEIDGKLNDISLEAQKRCVLT